MDPIALVAEDNIVEGQQLVDKLTELGFAIESAFWAKTDEDDGWYLYIVHPGLERELRPDSYRVVRSVIQGMDSTFQLSSLAVKLLSPKRPLAKGILALQTQNPSTRMVRCGERSFGLTHIEGALIYPPRKTAKA